MERRINCERCNKYLAIAYLESVWEDNDEKTYRLIHFECVECIGKRTKIELQNTITQESQS